MKYTVTKKSPTQIELAVTVDTKDLAAIKKETVARLSTKVKVPGFRPGKVPANVAEKSLDEDALQAQVVEDAANRFYLESILDSQEQPLERPNVSITKFDPYTLLTFTASVQVVPDIKLADYKKIKVTKPKVTVKAADITEVLERLQQNVAEKKEVDRAARDNDEILIDFAGKDDAGQEVAGATGTDYPLKLGSKTFIPGFEENLVGLKKGDAKEFTITFPKDYGHPPLANKAVTFTVTAKKVNEVVLPKADDAFAAKVGSFKSLDELKDDIKKELKNQKEVEAESQLKNEIIEALVKKSDVPLPPSLVDDQVRMVKQDMAQNLAYRGLTLADHLANEKLTEEEWIAKEVQPQAERRVKTGLILAEISKKEKIRVSDPEVDQRATQMKQQTQDPNMQAQLDTHEVRRDLASRMVTEKVIDFLLHSATTAKPKAAK